MTHEEVGQYWNANAEAWTRLARAGYDIYRDHLNTPAFFAKLPPVDNLAGIDLGCGEGHNTRLLARRGARMTAVDISEVVIGHAREEELREPLGIDFRLASIVELPFSDATFDFATGFMSFMDVPETHRVLAEAHRVLRPGGFLQFSITHPCFTTPHRRNLRDERRVTYAIEVGRYFNPVHGDIEEWIFGAAPSELRSAWPKFRVPRFHSTISGWLNLVLEAGFALERVDEPMPSDATVGERPDLQDAQIVAYFLHVRARKAGGRLREGRAPEI